MLDSTGGRLVLTLAVVAIAVVIGLVLRARQGHSRKVVDSAPRLHELLPTAALDDGGVVVQISAAVCGPCRATARTWLRVLPESRHHELDIEQHPDVAEALRVWRTPASFVFDGDGELVARLEGTPTIAQASAALITSKETAR